MKLINDRLYRKKILFLSPHIDDIAYSCSSLLTLRSLISDFTLVNVFSRSKYAPNLLSQDSEVISFIRDMEDISLCTYYDISRINIGFPDSSLRGYTDASELLGDVANDFISLDVINKVVEVVNSIDFHFILVPISIGNHIDHNIVLEAVLNANIPISKVLFYEDLPYTLGFNENQIFEYLYKKINKKIEIEPYIGRFDRHIKEQNISNYSSQFNASTFSRIIEYSTNIIKNGFHIEKFWSLCTK